MRKLHNAPYNKVFIKSDSMPQCWSCTSCTCARTHVHQPSKHDTHSNFHVWNHRPI